MTFHKHQSRRGNFHRRHNSRKKSAKKFGETIGIEKYTKTAKPITLEQYTAQNTFQSMGVHPDILRSLERKNYSQPSPIQDQAIPHVIAGKDVIGLAATGTGKTAAFLVPILQKTLEKKNKTATLIVCPTRELAMQIEQELFELKHKSMNIFSVLLVGGISLDSQLRKLRMPNQFFIGTPGRIKDLIQRGKLNLSQVETVVLDEVDRMLDMGFLDDVTFIVDQLPKERQSLFFSATVDPKQQQIITKLTKDPITVQVSTMGNSSDNVHQSAVVIESHTNKYQLLTETLKQKDVEKAIIFCRTKHGSEKLSRDLYKEGFPSVSLHGDMSQSQRKRALESFKNSNSLILVATDVAARGIDVKDVSHVINYDEPATHDEYIHRIGRTGRAGNIGHAITFVDREK